MSVHSKLNFVSLLKELLVRAAVEQAILVPPPSPETRVQRIVIPIIMFECFQVSSLDLGLHAFGGSPESISYSSQSVHHDLNAT